MGRQSNDTAKQMTASGMWAKTGTTWVHASGVKIERAGNGMWAVNGFRYGTLYTARWVAENTSAK